MSIRRDDWEKPRSKGIHLTHAEISKIRVAFNTGRHPSDIARELKCSSRIACKYYATFRGGAAQKHRRVIPIMVLRPEPVAVSARFYKSDFEI